MTTSSDRELPIGLVVTGKWNSSSYVVERLLGGGSNGKVYLVRRGKAQYAMKVGLDAIDFQSEINALKAVDSSRKLGARFFVEADDVRFEGKRLPFYVMKYIQGDTLDGFLRRRGKEWLHLIGFHVLCRLQELHSKQCIFGDLKKENIMISDYGQVDLVDYGGVTAFGSSVKQFTQIYDRGYWGAGSRSADVGYDLFSYAVLCLHSVEHAGLHEITHRSLPQTRQAEDLIDLVRSSAHLKQVAPILVRALRGQYASTQSAIADWRQVMHVPRRSLAKLTGIQTMWIKSVFVGSLCTLAFTMYLVLR